MNKKFIISWLAVFIVWMIGSFLHHGLWLADDYAALGDMMRSVEAQEGLMHFMLIAHVILAGAFVWIYMRGQEDKPWMQQGLRFGLAIALLAPIPTFMIYYVVQPTPAALAFKQALGDSVIVIVLGLLVAFLNKPAATTATAE